MKKPNNKELLEIMAKEIFKLRDDLVILKDRIADIDEDLYGEKEYDLQVADEELVRFTKEFYKEICKYCGNKGLDFMGIA